MAIGNKKDFRFVLRRTVSMDFFEPYIGFVKGRIFLLIISFCICVLAGCTTTSPGGYGYTSSYFVKKGWMKVNRFEAGENTPYKRITYEMKCENIDMLISKMGMPDYYRTTGLWDVYYGYVNTGIIYHLNTNHHGKIIESFHYTKIYTTLPYYMLADFTKKDPEIQINITKAAQQDGNITSEQKKKAVIRINTDDSGKILVPMN